MIDPATLQLTINDFTDFLLQYFIALAAVGALAMALIELWKKVRASQTRYHGRSVTRWFRQSDAAFDVIRRQAIGRDEVSGNAAYAELIELTTGVPPEHARRTAGVLLDRGRVPAGLVWVESHAEYALFALALERMMGHVQDAADSALNTPQRYPSLYLFVTAGADPKDVGAWFEMAQTTPKGDDREEAKRRADLYARLHQLVRRKLDGFQVYAEQKWVNWNQLWANIAGVIVLFAALTWGRDFTAEATRHALPTIILFSLLGGILSPVAKDIVVALRRVRGG